MEKEYIIREMKAMPSKFGELPSYLNDRTYEEVIAWCRNHQVAGRLIRFESQDGKSKYWAVVR